MQPNPHDYDFELDKALSAVVGVRALVPPDAFTAGTLGTERSGNGVLIRPDGIVLTIGYLVTEAETIWLSLWDGRIVPGHVLGYDQETGFGLIQVLARLSLPYLELGQSSQARVGDHVVVGGAGGRRHAVAARIIARQEFAGYWEYLLDEALFTAPAHPHWGGTGLIGADGTLLGIGSLQLQQSRPDGRSEDLNMMVPIDLVKPILEDLLTRGQSSRPPRPWLGLYATELDNKIVIAGLASRGPAQRSQVRTGDVVIAVDGEEVKTLGGFFRKVWSLGEAGVEVPLQVFRNSRMQEIRIKSGDRRKYLKAPQLH